MTEYYNIEDINCSKKGDKWSCSITRRLSDDPHRINNQICFMTKTETIENIEHVELQEGTNLKCSVMDSGNGKFIRCEAIK